MRQLRVRIPFVARGWGEDDTPYAADDNIVGADDYIAWLLRDVPGCVEEVTLDEGVAAMARGEDGLEALTKDGLLELATAEGVSGVNARTRKDDLVAAIREHRSSSGQDAAQQDESDEPDPEPSAPAPPPPADAVLIGYRNDGEPILAVVGPSTDARLRHSVEVPEGDAQASEAALSVAVDVSGLTGIAVVDEGERVLLRIDGGNAAGAIFDERRPSEETLSYWLSELAPTIDTSGMDRDDLVKTIVGQSEAA